MSQNGDKRYVDKLLGWLRERELDFELAARCAGLGVWHWDLLSNEIVWSDRCRQLLGITPDVQPSPDAFLAVVHPDDRARVAERSGTARSDRAPHDHEYRIVLPSGDLRWLHSAWRTQFDPRTGTAVRALGILLDVTQQRHAEETNRLWAEAFVHNTRGIAIVDSATDALRSVNTTYAQLVGFAPEELRGKPVLTVYPASEHERIVAAARSAEMNGAAGFHSCLLHRDGTLIPVEMSIVCVRDASGRVTNRILTVADIREQLRVEGELRHAEAQLMAAERFRQLAEFAPIGILLTDADGACSYANPCWLQVSGLHMEQARELGWWDAIHKDDRARVDEAWKRLTQGAHFDLEFRYQRASGETRWVHARANSLRDDRSTTVGYICVDVDITERLQQREAIDWFHGRVRSLAHRLEHLREDERGQLAQKLHGTLRQDMTTLKSELDTLRGPAAANDESHSSLDRAAELADRCLNRLRHIAFELQPPGIDDLGFVGALRRYADECAAETGLNIQIMAVEPLPDLGRKRLLALFRAFQEALTNVVRHAHARRVDVQVAPHEDSLRLRMIDDGVGMGEHDRQKAGAFGLLAISERLAQIGGTLRVFGVAGQGTTLEATVPIGARAGRRRDSAQR